MDPTLAWGLGLLVLAVIIFGAELFLPSMGILSVVAGLSLITGVVFLFRYDTNWGLTGALVSVVLVPTFIAFMLKVWPHTPFGRRIIGKPLEEELGEQQASEDQQRRAREALIGKVGTSLGDLRPVGTALIDDQRLEVMSEIGFIPAHTQIRVVSADLTTIKVRAVG
jgi:membrane-bound ClpP family serine protease